MFFVFGWGKSVKNEFLGLCRCTKCQRLIPFRAYKTYKYFSIFFIPIKSAPEFFVMCPVCGEKIVIPDWLYYEIRKANKNRLGKKVFSLWKKTTKALNKKVKTAPQGTQIDWDTFENEISTVLLPKYKKHEAEMCWIIKTIVDVFGRKINTQPDLYTALKNGYKYEVSRSVGSLNLSGPPIFRD